MELGFRLNQLLTLLFGKDKKKTNKKQNETKQNYTAVSSAYYFVMKETFPCNWHIYQIIATLSIKC